MHVLQDQWDQPKCMSTEPSQNACQLSPCKLVNFGLLFLNSYYGLRWALWILLWFATILCRLLHLLLFQDSQLLKNKLKALVLAAASGKKYFFFTPQYQGAIATALIWFVTLWQLLPTNARSVSLILHRLVCLELLETHSETKTCGIDNLFNKERKGSHRVDLFN
jgi:hypothetical protein